MKKILLVFGTRPEAIKMAPIFRELKRYPQDFEPVICVTGQHRQMLDQMLRVFDISPDYDLQIMDKANDLYDLTALVLTEMRDIIAEVNPDIMLVHGDTTTSFAAALAAFYNRIPVGHVEAGLRTHNIYSPWPEEMNRQLTCRIATFHFAPSDQCRRNLLEEGVDEEKIVVTGNTVIDALEWVFEKIDSSPEICRSINDELKIAGYNPSRLDKRKPVLITAHRRENFGEEFASICHAIDLLALKYPDTDFVFPLHLNPNIRETAYRIFGQPDQRPENLFLIEPLSYIAFSKIMSESSIILTDSGGIQEEAPALGKPVLVLRETTERTEVLGERVKLIGTNREVIVRETSNLLDNSSLHKDSRIRRSCYGDGRASSRIVEALKYINL
ncbi:MAG: UDP-N-acetylglucosamine 2-epimerase (non-hydrolyzing) [Muribaculaceae bacterium]|nr:UDP-N-acetylglucosamine 2-epimerase (non-hydrolyzing) [Muribaculaceae bacterium]